MAEVGWSEESLRHLQAIFDYIAVDSVAAAQAQVSRIRDSVERLNEFPRSGRMIPRVERDDLREVVTGNYRIAYSLLGDEIVVVAVHHGAREVSGGDR